MATVPGAVHPQDRLVERQATFMCRTTSTVVFSSFGHQPCPRVSAFVAPEVMMSSLQFSNFLRGPKFSRGVGGAKFRLLQLGLGLATAIAMGSRAQQ